MRYVQPTALLIGEATALVLSDGRGNKMGIGGDGASCPRDSMNCLTYEIDD